MSWLRFDANHAAISFNDLLHDSQSNACALVTPTRVQSLEEHENPVKLVGLYPDPIVSYTENPRVCISLDAQMDCWDNVGAAELDCIAKKVQQHLGKQCLVAILFGTQIAS